MAWTRTLFFLSLFFWGPLAQALQVYGIIDKTCKKTTGLIVYSDENNVFVLSKEGQLKSFTPEDIDAILVFDTFENPLPKINLTPRLSQYLRKVYLDNTDEPTAIAWPTQFIEDLVVFYDISSNSHVYSTDQINRLRPVTEPPTLRKKTRVKPTSFDFTSLSSRCTGLEKAKGDVRPTRILADKIKLSDFLSTLQEGYLALDRFQERTYLYAKPFLYEKSSRLGLIYKDNNQQEESSDNFPLYFQWSKGRPYQFQSFTVLGGKPIEFLPNVESVAAIRSDVKSHIFHGFLAGNLSGMSAGKSLYEARRWLDEENKNLSVESSFNYMALMGGDFGPFSISFGYFFPSFGIKVRDNFREVLGSNTSYAVRFMVTKPKFRVRAVASISEFNSDDPNDEDVMAWTEGSYTTFNPNSFSFKSQFIRSGLDYHLTKHLHISIDAVILNGSYEEVALSQDNSIDFQRFVTSLKVTQSFSDYVTVNLYWNNFRFDYDSNFFGQSESDISDAQSILGSFEFVF